MPLGRGEGVATSGYNRSGIERHPLEELARGWHAANNHAGLRGW